MPTFELIKSETLMQGRAFKIRRDHLLTPDGRETKFEIIEHGGSVIIVPVDANGNLLFVRQYRHAAGVELLELPAGTLEPGEDPQVCAHREIREETGMAAGRLQKIGEFFLAPGYSTEYMHVYLAQDLVHDPLPGDQDEFLSVERYPLGQAYAMLQRGEIRDAKTIAALSIAQHFIELG